MKLLFRYLTLISSNKWTHIRQIRNNRLILAQFQTVITLVYYSTQEYAKVYCTYKSAIIIGLDHKLRSASYQNLPICMKVVSRQTYTLTDNLTLSTADATVADNMNLASGPDEVSEFKSFGQDGIQFSSASSNVAHEVESYQGQQN